ncbi:MAG TPA: hypothetical protein DEP42_02380 [Ruminococcaceae bacterium]|nr:hypothetical protein [Oscillospiraceae bacterium]
MTNQLNQAKNLFQNQPGVILRMRAKPGKGNELFDLTTQLHYVEDPDGPVDWALCRTNDEPDTLWAFELYRDDASFTRHYANPIIDKRHDHVFALLADMPLRADIHVVCSSNTEQEIASITENPSFHKGQPGVVLRMQAKPGKGSGLFALTTQLHHVEDPDGPTDWMLCRVNDEPDTLWAFEFYRNDASFTRHYANPIVDKRHDDVIALLADMPLRADLHIESSSTQPTE